MIARHYLMVAAAGQEDALAAALCALASAVNKIEGAKGCDILRDIDQPGRFHFIERWVSIEAHKAGGSSLPKEMLKPVMAALGQPPEAGYSEYLIQA